MCIRCVLKELGIDLEKEDLLDEDELEEMFGGMEGPKQDPAKAFGEFMDSLIKASKKGQKKEAIAVAIGNAEHTAKHLANTLDLLKKIDQAMETMKRVAQQMGSPAAEDIANIRFLVRTLAMNRGLATAVAENARIVHQKDKNRYKFEIVSEFSGSAFNVSELTIQIRDEPGQKEGGSLFG